MEEEAASRRRSVNPICKAGKVNPDTLELGGELNKLSNRSAETIQLPDHKCIARAQMRARICKPSSITADRRQLVGENPLAASTSQRIDLKVEALISGRHSRVSDQHASLSQISCSPPNLRRRFRDRVFGPLTFR